MMRALTYNVVIFSDIARMQSEIQQVQTIAF